MSKTKKQQWHDRFVDLAIEMGRDRHTGPRRAMVQASFWLKRAQVRMREGIDPKTGERRR